MATLARTLAEYGATLNNLPLKARSQALDRRRPKAKPYWSTVIEMAARAFESWTIAKLAAAGIRNDYLANVAGSGEWAGKPELDQGYPYP
ncbi:LPD1 domain-containing protein, partial [Methylobacterium crusticola]|uniref:LPD1 domain-containing protein n=1 Tax=Methylobacterium crusticola TaxID=1697972 RepID=UPI001EE1671F